MARTIYYPDGSQMQSTALTPKELETAFQYATAVMLGLDLNDPNVWSWVRIGWGTEGQPFNNITDDVTYIRAEPIDTDYSRLRDNQLVKDISIGWGLDEWGSSRYGSPIDMVGKDVFTRSWKTIWIFYGPNSLNNAKAVQSALIKVPFIDGLLAEKNLYINPSIHEPERVPENFQGQWWERVDLEVELNEQVTEILSVGSVKSVEIQVYTKDGMIADYTVTAPD
jgi:hypothetical protein